MKMRRNVASLVTVLVLFSLASCTTSREMADSKGAQSDLEKAAKVNPAMAGIDLAQVPGWPHDDISFFLHGSMSAEFVPERVLRAFMRTYPDLFPQSDLSNFGLLPDPAFGWPIGFSRRPVAHLGGLPSVGVNCAACHVSDVLPAGTGKVVRVLGMTSHFDAEAFFGAVTVATFRTADPISMRRYLGAYATAGPAGVDMSQNFTTIEVQRGIEMGQELESIREAVADDPFGSKGIAPGALHPISPVDLDFQKVPGRIEDLKATVTAHLRLFHNMRAALHIPDKLPETVPPASGPGRNDAFGLLALALLGQPQPYAPVKYGLVWNLEKRPWVHWDGNTRTPIARNLLAALGLGGPLIGKQGLLVFADVDRQTQISERIRSPRYPFAIDQAAAGRGVATYQARCASCHDGPESDARLHTAAEVGTDPRRAGLSQLQADGFNKVLAELESPGYRPPSSPGIRGTGKYWAAGLAGVWARSPYLHNGSVRTMQELLSPPSARAKSFRRGSRVYDAERLGYLDEGPYVLDATSPGNSNGGHDYGTDLSAQQQRDLIEFLTTL